MWWYVPSLAPPHFTWVLPCLAWAWKLFHVFILGTWLLLSLFPTPKPKPVPPWICRAGKALPVLAKWNVWSWSRKAQGSALSLSIGVGYQCFEQGSLPLGEPSSSPQIFSVAAGASQVKDPRTFLPVCTWHRGAGRAVTGPAVPPILKKWFLLLSSLLCRSKFRRVRKKNLWLSFSSFATHPTPPSLARCSLLAPARNSFLGGCCQSYSILPGTEKRVPWANTEYPGISGPSYCLVWFVSWRSRYFPLWKEGRPVNCTLSPAPWSPVRHIPLPSSTHHFLTLNWNGQWQACSQVVFASTP